MSSSTTLWATASKEWVIPAKPKPGRKPKKDTIQPVQEPEVDNKGRRVQNRAAQRAFRERKQSQLAELQARVQQYEQGEVERNVALQNIAKRLKEENEKLRSENSLLKEKIGQLEVSQDISKKRTRGDSLPKSPTLPLNQFARKKSKLTPDPPNFALLSSMASYEGVSSPSSVGSSPSPSSLPSSHNSFSPAPMHSSSHDTQGGNQLTNVFDLSVDAKSSLFEGGPLSCGFCSESISCVCKEITMQQVSEQLRVSDPASQINSGQHGNSAMQLDLRSSASTANSPPSILDNLPEYQAPVPLRRRTPVGSVRPVFSISSSSNSANTASCSGDPSNCLACADDAFGKAFCDAIGRSVASTSSSSCGYCPDPSQLTASTNTVNGCCGNPMACGSVGCGPAADSAPPAQDTSILINDLAATSETISCDTAWRELKLHPNVDFADLSLLADVVARRSRCTGPHVEIVPAPGSITPERNMSPSGAATSPLSPHTTSAQQSRYDSRQAANSPPPQLVPQEVLISCGRQRVREVMADGVRDALRLLDAKFPLSGRMNDFRT